MFSELPQFNAARRYGISLLVLGTVFAILGFWLLNGGRARATLPWFPDTWSPSSVGFLGAALWLVSAAFFSAAMMSIARRRCLAGETERKVRTQHHRTSPEGPARGPVPLRARVSGFVSRFASRIDDPATVAEWPQALLPVLFGLLAIKGIFSWWSLPTETLVAPGVLKLLASLFVVAAFPILLLERMYANYSAELLPEAPQLERLLRVPLTTCVVLAIALFLRSAGFVWAVQLEGLMALVIVLVASEIVLRGAVTMFVPFAPIERRISVADSSIAGSVLRLSVPSFSAIHITVRRQLGIDLSRSWALAFVQKAALPILVGIGVFAWCVTGLTSLGISQRGVYERFGMPVAVFGPGLHVHLPWPLGVIRPIEVGVIHELPIEFLLPNGSGQTVNEEEPETVDAEAVPPPGADRLWDGAHPFEGSYLIASEENRQQSFQLVDVDMAVIYQIGLSDGAARNAAYSIDRPDELIQALSGQILVRYLSENTLLDLLGRSRETFSTDFQAALQKQLDGFAAGIEVLAISVEAIHPPPAAASAYHDVQAAEIRATAKISHSRGEAVGTVKLAERKALEARNGALASAAELTGKAQTSAVLFGGDREAVNKNRNAFLLERWFGNLTRALGRSEFVVIDHRLSGQEVPTLDLRDFGQLPPNERGEAGDDVPELRRLPPPDDDRD
jgi:regulator of protease activity HflC (stomatin/prohibitin superfamily)